MSEIKKPIQKKETFKCSQCQKDHPIGDKNIIGNEREGITNLCASCFVRLSGNGTINDCIDCGDRHLSSRLIRARTRTSLTARVCHECLEDNYHQCVGCGLFSHDGLDELCSCQQNNANIHMRSFNKKCRTFLSKKDELGDIIQSPRKFGVEIEVFNDKRDNIIGLSKTIAKDFGFDHDGSIKDDSGMNHPNGVEIVTPPMSGKKGEDGMVDLLKKINEKEFAVNNSCGLHAHFSADDFNNEIKITYTRVSSVCKDNYNPKLSGFIIKKELMQFLSQYANTEQIIDTLSYQFIEQGSFSNATSTIKKQLGIPDHVNVRRIQTAEKYGIVTYDGKEIPSVLKVFSPTELDIKEARDKANVAREAGDYKSSDPRVKTESDDYFCQVSRKDNLRNVKTLFYLYTAFQDVFLSMLPYDRREKNRHCQKLTSKFSLLDIEQIQSYDDLESLWFKTTNGREKRIKKGDQYDDSRYYGFNLHSLFGKYGTIEIRHHDGTLDIDNILYWIALHQTILDRVSTKQVDIHRLSEGADLFSVEDKTKYLLEALGLRQGLREYINTKIKHFKK